VNEMPDPVPDMVRSAKQGVSRREMIGAMCQAVRPTILRVLCSE